MWHQNWLSVPNALATLELTTVLRRIWDSGNAVTSSNERSRIEVPASTLKALFSERASATARGDISSSFDLDLQSTTAFCY